MTMTVMTHTELVGFIADTIRKLEITPAQRQLMADGFARQLRVIHKRFNYSRFILACGAEICV